MKTDGQLLQGWREQLERFAGEVENAVRPLSDEQLRWNPPTGGWSVAQVLDHLAQTNEEYLALIRSALRQPPRGEPNGGWQPSFVGGFLAKVITSPRKAPAPRAFRPSSLASPDPIGRFMASISALLDEMKRAAGHDLRRTRTHSPASRLARLNLGDAFHLQVLHTERHLGQVRRVVAAYGNRFTEPKQ